MSEDKLRAMLDPSAAVRTQEEMESLLAEEQRLWELVMQLPADNSRHAAYFAYVTHNGLLKEGSRRYGTIVQARDEFSVEARRQFRQYQKAFVNLIFMGGPKQIREKKRSTIEFMAFFTLAIMVVFGLILIFTPGWRAYGFLMFIFAVSAIAVSVYLKIKRISEELDAEQRFIP